MQYARLAMFQMGPNMRDFATSMADAAYQKATALNGFVSATYMVFDEDAGEYGSLTIWDSKQNADAAGEVFSTWMSEEAGDKLTAPPVIKQAEVYEPA